MFDQTVIFSSKYLPILIVLSAFSFVLFSKLYQKKKEILILSVLISGIALTLDKILNAIVYSPRPFVVEKITPLVYHINDNGFPSEHTLFTLVISGIIFVYDKKMGVVLGILSIGVGIARVLAKVHSPVDILGSIAIAAVSVSAGYYLHHKFFTQTSKSRT